MTERRTGGWVPGSWSSVATGLVATLFVAAVLALPTVAQTDPPSATGRAGWVSSLIARGPFGSVPGVPLPPEATLPDPATLEALDAYGRGATVTFAPSIGSLDHWRATASRESGAETTSALELGAGESADFATIRLPASGLFLIRLDGTLVDPANPGDPGRAGSWVWRIAVPDRDVPGGGDPYPPMPAIVLTSGDQSIDLDPGSGCFIGTCGDIGATSPPQTLPTIRTIAGTSLNVRLSDGSGITAWSADATPIGATNDKTVPLGSGTVDPATHIVTFAAPAQGRWVIVMHVRFDRDRGATDGYGRLILGPNGHARVVGRFSTPG